MTKRTLEIPIAPERDRNWLLAAAIYNGIWAIWVGVFPEHYFDLIEMPHPNYIGIWQCIGMFVGVFGIGYAIAALDPFRYWPIVLVGLMGKILGPLGFFYHASIGLLPLKFGLITLTNDFIWIYPFFRILKEYYNLHINEEPSLYSPNEVIKNSVDQFGSSNSKLLKENSKLAFIFLRHIGCTFCREFTDDVSKRISEIEKNYKVVFVHGESHEDAGPFFSGYKLEHCTRISDPTRIIYKAVGLSRGSFLELLGPREWMKGFISATIKGYGVGWSNADPLQMPGIVIFENEEIIKKDFPKQASDQPDIELLVKELVRNAVN